MAGAITLNRAALLLVCLLLHGCGGIFFYPMEDWVQNPARQGLDYEDVILIHEDGLRLHGWWLPAAGGTIEGTVYFLHGNAQNVSTHLMNVAWLPERGYQVFILDYRGYGLSEGRPRVAGVVSDVQLGLDWLNASGRSVDAPLIVFGQSLGASLAARVMGDPANQGTADCVILEAGFTGYRDITRDVMRKSWLLSPLRFLITPTLSRDHDAIDHIAAIAPTPLLIMHSEEDEIIPYHHGERLFEAANEPKAFQRLRGRHIRSTMADDVRGRLVGFMREDCRRTDDDLPDAEPLPLPVRKQ